MTKQKLCNPRLLAIAAAICLVAINTACRTQNPHAAAIHELAASLHAAGEFDGAVLVAQGGEVVYRQAFGIQDCENGAENSPDTVFDLASISKPFTALAVLMLSEEGLVDLQAPVGTYLNDWPYPEITIEHLLTHSSGIPDYSHHPGLTAYLDRAGPDWADSSDVVLWLTNSTPAQDFPAGEQRRYSNTGYVVLARIVETVSGSSYEAFVEDRILRPAGMARSFIWDRREEEPVDRWSHPHQRSLDRASREPFDDSGHHDARLAGVRGACGVFSTVDDLFVFDQALYSGDLVGAETLAQAFELHRLKDGSDDIYGYGWITRSKVDEPKVVWHGGKGGGYLTSFHREIGARNTVIVLSNSSAHHLTIDEFGAAILDILHERDYRRPRVQISHPVAACLFEEGPDAAVALYRRLRGQSEDNFIFDEYQLNLLGYRLMWAGRLDGALAILELNAEEYADSANVHDSLGDALAQAGKNREAAASFNRALELDPTLAPTRQKLEALPDENSSHDRGGPD